MRYVRYVMEAMQATAFIVGHGKPQQSGCATTEASQNHGQAFTRMPLNRADGCS
jgi:hypothetical protein